MTESVTVTFLFSDIEGSSRMWELDLAGMDASLELHDRVLKAAVEKWHGRTFKTMGDAFCCAFEDAADAVHAAVEAQLELARQSWPESIGPIRVRIGLNTGAAIRSETDFVGPALNRTARVMSSGHGGQILASSATVAVIGAPPDGIVFRDLGVKRLKDLEYPERVFQVVAAGLSVSFPPLRTLDEHPNNLPTQLSSFVGRRAELERLRTAFTQSRVVTVAGPGGIGKTRLAVQFGSENVHRFPGGVFLIELASVTNAALLQHVVVAALGLRENAAEAPIDTIARFIGEQSVLLIVDNSEHLLNDVAAMVKALALRCNALMVLVTSREPLHLTGERVERLAALSLPDRIDASELETSDGCKLFLERARASGGAVAGAPGDVEAIVSICRRLDGIPLAIEIAASRTATIPLRRLAERLDAHLLVNRDPTVVERHRTLAKAIDWSFELLNDDEKRAFLAMSVFRGGCTVAALAYVLDADADDTLESLLDKSLLHETPGGDGEPRYRFSDPTREYAAGHCDTQFEAGHLEQRHCDYFSNVAGDAGGVADDRFARIAADIDNVRAALDWSLRPSAPQSGASAFILAMTSYWRARSWFTEARLWLERARKVSTRGSPELTRQAAAFAAMQDDYNTATSLAEEALVAYKNANDELGVGKVQHTLGEIAHRQGRWEDAEHLYGEALVHLRTARHLLGTTTCLINLGLLAREREDLQSAHSLLNEAAEFAAELHSPNVSAQLLIEQGWLALSEHRTEDGRRLFQEALEEKLTQRDLHGICQARLGVATAALLDSDAANAMAEFETALREAHRLEARSFVSDSLYGLAGANALQNQVKASAACYRLARDFSVKMKIGNRRGLAQKLVETYLAADLGNGQFSGAAALCASFRYTDPEGAISRMRSLRDYL
ncbi:MAG TPA: adenylate/guanylate cyclase domain-containing protein [Candidatus Tumulicola sp.]|jgi:predicted ATPase/class 3 adenylate cyclase